MPRRLSGSLVAFVLAGTAAACAGKCGALGGMPPQAPPMVQGPDGRMYHLVVKGPYRAFYDGGGSLQRLEYDQNGDGVTDHIAHHNGSRTPRTIEIDEDFDGKTDRWEDYEPSGRLFQIGVSRRGRAPDMWTVLGETGEPVRRRYDDDVDGRIERTELLQDGKVVGLELDTDGDGKVDRWQTWRDGALQSETLDTDGNGQADRRIRYGAGRAVIGVERLSR